MPILTIVTGEKHPSLRRKAVPVKRVNKEILGLIENMIETTVAAKGAGLAAPQVDRTERLCIALIDGKLTPLINPTIIWRSTEKDSHEEGCLSLPNIWLMIERPIEIVVTFLAESGKKRELKLSGFNARVVQHEVDHLEGVLIVDHVQSTKSKLHEKPL
jgi:peptide deformylase